MERLFIRGASEETQGRAEGKRGAVQRGFTLIEMLVVIAIIGILAALLMPSLQSARKQAQMISCVNNQKQMHLGLMMYASDWNGTLPFPTDGAFPGVIIQVPQATGNSGYNKSNWMFILRDNYGFNQQGFLCPINQLLPFSSTWGGGHITGMGFKNNRYTDKAAISNYTMNGRTLSLYENNLPNKGGMHGKITNGDMPSRTIVVTEYIQPLMLENNYVNMFTKGITYFYKMGTSADATYYIRDHYGAGLNLVTLAGSANTIRYPDNPRKYTFVTRKANVNETDNSYKSLWE